jgi:hypothetical protein
MAGAITNLLSNYTSLSYKVTPLWNNVICSLITVIYVKAILTIGAKLRDRLRCAYESRKLVHMGAACWILFWPLFDVSHWTWRLNILVPTVMGIKLVYKVSSVLFCSVLFSSLGDDRHHRHFFRTCQYNISNKYIGFILDLVPVINIRGPS